jgi:hypothetical protein
MVDRPETDGAVYVTGWTISGLAVLGAVVAVWAGSDRHVEPSGPDQPVSVEATGRPYGAPERRVLHSYSERHRIATQM